MTGVRFLAGAEIFFLIATMSRPNMGPTQLPIQWVLGVLLSGVKLPGHEADLHLMPRLRKCGATPPLPEYAFVVWYMVKYMDKFTFAFNSVLREIWTTPITV